jgi:hypothetical protein
MSYPQNNDANLDPTTTQDGRHKSKVDIVAGRYLHGDKTTSHNSPFIV